MKQTIKAYVERSPVNGVLFLLLLIFTGASVFSFIGFVLSELFLGVPLLSQPSLLNHLTNPELLPALRLMQVLQAMGMLILPAALYLWVSASEEIQQLFSVPDRQSVLLSVAFFMVAFPFVNFIADWNAGIEIPSFLGDWMKGKELQAGELTGLFLKMPDIWLLVFNLFMIALLPAIGEELIFRGIIQRAFQKQFGNPHLAIWLAAVLFSAIHLQFFGFVPRMLMGVAMGYMLLWSGNLWCPIIAHFTNNAVSVVVAYGIQHGTVEPDIENMGLNDLTMAAFSLLFCMLLLYLFKKHQEGRQAFASDRA